MIHIPSNHILREIRWGDKVELFAIPPYMTAGTIARHAYEWISGKGSRVNQHFRIHAQPITAFVGDMGINTLVVEEYELRERV